ncbi:MAG TPA: hypothetical protein V6D26_22955 [Stenomitos sp.]
MTNIKLNELQPDESKQPKGSEFFEEEQEGYLDNLSEEEMDARGGADDISISGGEYVSTGTYLSTGPGSDISIGDLD